MACIHDENDRNVIYFDNAATSWPKPDCVTEAMSDFMNNTGANPGRSGHRLSVEAGRVVYFAREKIARLFNLKDPMRVVFTLNATEGLNLGMRGMLHRGDHVITSSMEHNSVMRPLRDLESQGIRVTVVKCSREGFLDPEDVRNAIESDTKMMVINHGSNVVGSLAPIREIGKIARDLNIKYMIDSAQTAGSISLEMERDNIDLVAFTGHKGLMGPTGTGGLAIGENVDINEFDRMRSGGSGSKSEFERHPDFLPDKYESGTLNAVGLAGLSAGVSYILDRTVEKIHETKMALTARFMDRVKDMNGLNVYGGNDLKRQTSVVSINIRDRSQSEIGLLLEEQFNIMCRVGLHCAPSAHRTIGTFPDGTVRFGFGYFNRREEIDIAVEALEELVG